ncbi:MAG: cytochrome c [Flavobacteriaceae bacterium]|nr:cytochrome c [Flavobacteriaceae bacterium]
MNFKKYENKHRNRVIISVLVFTFIIYNYFVYSSGTENHAPKLTEEAIKGQDLWQENNCWTCHQLYGLGGYLGPDLTNIISHPNKGENYIKGFINSGVKSMPKYNFTETEKDQIIAFLRAVDQTGYFPNYKANLQPNGWVELNYKSADSISHPSNK